MKHDQAFKDAMQHARHDARRRADAWWEDPKQLAKVQPPRKTAGSEQQRQMQRDLRPEHEIARAYNVDPKYIRELKSRRP